jgi:hypothetical protein
MVSRVNIMPQNYYPDPYPGQLAERPSEQEFKIQTQGYNGPLSHILTSSGDLVFNKDTLQLDASMIRATLSALSKSLDRLIVHHMEYISKIKPNRLQKLWQKPAPDHSWIPIVEQEQKFLEDLKKVRDYLNSGELLIRSELGRCSDNKIKSILLECVQLIEIARKQIINLTRLGETIMKNIEH